MSEADRTAKAMAEVGDRAKIHGEQLAIAVAAAISARRLPLEARLELVAAAFDEWREIGLEIVREAIAGEEADPPAVPRPPAALVN